MSTIGQATDYRAYHAAMIDHASAAEYRIELTEWAWNMVHHWIGRGDVAEAVLWLWWMGLYLRKAVEDALAMGDLTNDYLGRVAELPAAGLTDAQIFDAAYREILRRW